MNRYVAVVLVALTALVSLFALYEELDESQTTYGAKEALFYVFITIPRRVDELLIYSVFVGSILALGRLAETSELTVLQTSGRSPWTIFRYLVPSLLCWTILNLALSEYVAPLADRYATTQKIKAQFGSEGEGIAVGLWLRVEGTFMEIKAIDEHGNLWGVTQYVINQDRELRKIVSAKSATFIDSQEGWEFSQVDITSFDSGLVTRRQTLPKHIWNYPMTPDLLASKAFLDPDKMDLTALLEQIALNSDSATSQYDIAFWQRATKPLSCFALALFALSVILGPLREKAFGVRITFGLFAGLLFKYVQDLFAPATLVFQLPAWLGVLIPVAGFAAMSVYLVRRNS